MKKIAVATLVAIVATFGIAHAQVRPISTSYEVCYWIGGEMFCDWIDDGGWGW